MNKKLFYISVFLILALFLSGCGSSGIVTPTTESAKIKSVIHEYAHALNDQNWNKARSYCVYGSEPYYSVGLKEDVVQALYQYCYTVTLTYSVTINNVSINGNYAQANIYVDSIVSACGYFESYSENTTVYLQKVGNSWKIYDNS